MTASDSERLHIAPGPDGKADIRYGTILDFHFQNHTYELNSTDSLLSLIKRKGHPERSIITYTMNSISAILDDTVTDRPQDQVISKFETSPAWQAWASLLGRHIEQKPLVKFLQSRPTEEVPHILNLMMAVSNLSVATEISGDYRYEDNQNMTVAFKIKDKEGTTQIPKMLELPIILINEGALSQTIELEVELNIPKSANERPTFQLTCNKQAQYWQDAVKAEIAKLQEALPGYLVLSGAAKANNRYV